MQCLHHKAESERLHENAEGCCPPIAFRDRPCRQAQLQAALKTFQQALANAQANNDCVGQVQLLKRIGLVHCKLGEYAWGIKRLEQALQMAHSMENWASVGVILNYIGAAYRQTSQEHKALRVYLRALAIFKDRGDEAGVARICNQLGEIYNSFRQSEQALLCCRQALKLFQDLGNFPHGEAVALHNIGQAYCQLGRHRPALALFDQALVICNKIRDRKTQAMLLESIGTTYVKLDQEQRALDFYQQALEIRQEVGELPNAEARSLNYIGAVYYKLGNHSRALWYHLQALGILQALNHTAGKEWFFYNTADSERLLHHLVAVYDCLNLHEQGVKCYQEAVEIVKTFGDSATEEAILHYFEQDGSQSE